MRRERMPLYFGRMLAVIDGRKMGLLTDAEAIDKLTEVADEWGDETSTEETAAKKST